jgi:hypothetical protein
MATAGKRLRQAAWFVALWLGGVAVLTMVAGLIRWWLSPG